MPIQLNLFHTLAIAVIILLVGEYIRGKVEILQKFCIPTPVIGGLLFTLLVLIGYSTNTFTIKFDMALKDFFMLIFYSSIGFTASYKLLKQGGPLVIKFLIISSVVVVLQNLAGVVSSMVMGLDPLVGLATGSIPMTGGHGTSAAFAPVLEAKGLLNANTITIASATFGLVAGSLIGGPIGKYLIEKYKLRQSNSEIEIEENTLSESSATIARNNKGIERNLTVAFYQLLISMALGCVISDILAKTGMSFPSSVGGMLAAAVIRNIADHNTKIKLRLDEIMMWGNISLLIFLALSMMTLKLWEIADLAIPMVVLLIIQSIVMICSAIFITYRFMGKNFDAAVIAVGHCGFGLGAVPTAMANMKSISEKYGESQEAFFIVPLVGSLFINFINSVILTGFVNFL